MKSRLTWGVVRVVACAWATCAWAVSSAADVSASFDWTPGSNPTGSWFTSWGGENAGAPRNVVGPDGAVKNTHVVYFDANVDAQKWIPWKSGVAAKSDFTFVAYGSVDRVTAAAGQQAVLWCMGGRAENKIALIKDENANIRLVQVNGATTTIAQEINAGVVHGYHLFTVRFSTQTGASLQIDNGAVQANADFKTKAGGGIQIGSVLSGLDNLALTRGVGFIPLKMLCYDTATLPAEQYAGLVSAYPAVTALDALEIPAHSGEVMMPDVEITTGRIAIGVDSSLELSAGIASGGSAHDLAKYGAGVLTLTDAQGEFTGKCVLHEGKVRVKTDAGVSVETAVAEGDAREVLWVTDSVWTEYSFGVPQLRISEIMPKPSDAADSLDVNGLESGWVELENCTDHEIDLADYKFLRVNRSKATSKGDYGNFPSVKIPAHSRYVFYTSERYSNSADMSVSAWATPCATSEKTTLYGADLNNVLVWPDKINPKKFPFVRLVHMPSETIVDTVVIPYDIPDGNSIIVDPVETGKATTRWMTATPTRGAANATTGLIALGPNAGPLYEIKSQKKHDSASEFARVAAPAKSGEAYPITFSLNPTMHPTTVAAVRDEDMIASITLVYRADMGDEKQVAVDLATHSGILPS